MNETKTTDNCVLIQRRVLLHVGSDRTLRCAAPRHPRSFRTRCNPACITMLEKIAGCARTGVGVWGRRDKIYQHMYLRQSINSNEFYCFHVPLEHCHCLGLPRFVAPPSEQRLGMLELWERGKTRHLLDQASSSS